MGTLFDTPLAHTYSIVARDPATGELGVAAQSHWFAVGGVIWAEAGVGVVASQAFTDPTYGSMGLELMGIGRSAPDVLEGLLAVDKGREIRQVAMIDAQGRVAVHTGNQTISDAGHVTGNEFSVQANMMLNPTVPPAMATAFEAATGDLADRMLAALDAAEKEGGDVRGRQSAAMLVVKPKSTQRPWADKVFDLRVDDHREPLVELRRLAKVRRAYIAKIAGDSAFAKGDIDNGIREYIKAESLARNNLEFPFSRGVAMLLLGRPDDATEIFRAVFEKDRNWATLATRMVRSKLIACDEEVAIAAIEAARRRK
jgi:uncharacterized Ntn-hydrolase superfamily protein